MIMIGRQKHQNKEVMRYEKSNMPVLRFMQQMQTRVLYPY